MVSISNAFSFGYKLKYQRALEKYTLLSDSVLVCRGVAFSATGLSYYYANTILCTWFEQQQSHSCLVTKDTTYENFQATAFSQYVQLVLHLVFKAHKEKLLVCLV